jgi:hypothetical protein
MKRLIALLTLLPLLGMGGGQYTIPWHTGATAAAASGGITPVGTPVCGASGYAQSYNLSYTPYAAGDQLIVAAYGLPMTDQVVTDSAASTYTPLTGTGTQVFQIWGILSLPSGVTYIRISGTNYGFKLCVSEYAGGKHFGNTNTSGSWSGTSYTTSLTMQDANNYMVSVLGDYNYGQNMVPTATTGTLRTYTVDSNSTMAIQDNTSASAGSLSIAGTTSPSSSGNILSVELRSQ